MTPYYQDDAVTLWHGDCRELTTWLEADVLVTDPPYGIGWTGTAWGAWNRRAVGKSGISNDSTTAARDAVLDAWGGTRPAVVFGSPLKPPPEARQALVWHKPPNTGLIGTRTGWRRDWEAIYLLGEWPKRKAERSSVIATGGGMRSYLETDGHPHTKPVGLMVSVLEMCPPGKVADPFAGTGTTLAAAKQLGRQVVGIEIEERYCEMAARRLTQGVLTFDGGVA